MAHEVAKLSPRQRPRKRRVFAPELSELSDGPEDHGRQPGED